MNRSTRSKIAQETLEILEQGYYQTPSGKQIELDSLISQCLAGTKYFDLEELAELQQSILEQSKTSLDDTEISVINETTLTGARILANSGKYERVGVLNFASAKNPGGGFLGGSQAQEESLARSSALYLSLNKCFDYYQAHRNLKSALYSDRMIYSPDCPVFRDDQAQLLEQPYQVDFITSAAPNVGAIQKNQPHLVPSIPAIFQQRASKVLTIAKNQNCDALVLGAWGCGVFRNDPLMVAKMFAELLLDRQLFFGQFKCIRFSVWDQTKQQSILRAFTDVFSPEKI